MRTIATLLAVMVVLAISGSIYGHIDRKKTGRKHNRVRLCFLFLAYEQMSDECAHHPESKFDETLRVLLDFQP
ncbi:hypothetical protein [Salinicoccus bachuensis]|uniref:Secreted protein n=1 Tax=Salinicoccus bachuensis TaxID=3136731 RepID=A0ABZ3IDD2_9STAP